MAFAPTIANIACLAREAEAGATTPSTAWLIDREDPRTEAWINRENRLTRARLTSDKKFRPLYERSQFLSSLDPRPKGLNLFTFPIVFKEHLLKIEGSRKGEYFIRRREIGAQGRHRGGRFTIDLTDRPDFNYVEVAIGDCAPTLPRCFLTYSSEDGGTIEFREFDLAAMKFPVDGIVIPSGSSTVATWLDDNRVLLNREMPPAGPDGRRVLQMAPRWEILSRRTVSEGQDGVRRVAFDDENIAVEAWGAGAASLFLVAWKAKPLGVRTYFVRIDGKWKPLPLPQHQYQGMAVCGKRLFLSLSEDWNSGGLSFREKDLISFDLDDIGRGVLDPQLVSSSEVQGNTSIAKVRGGCYLLKYEGARPLLYFLSDTSSYNPEQVKLPNYYSIRFVASSGLDNGLTIKAGDVARAWTGYMVREGRAEKISGPSNSNNITAITRYAVSADGAKIPYTIFVSPGALQARRGAVPTIVTGYGAFGAPPSFEYNAHIESLWIAQGGAYVVASLRGGGEFRNWRTRGATRQLVYDDMAAVLRDVASSELTDRRHIGVWGQSAGGLLTAVTATQYPSLIRAAVAVAPAMNVADSNIVRYGSEFGSLDSHADVAFRRDTLPLNNISNALSEVEPMIISSSDDRSVIPSESRQFASELKNKKIKYLYYELRSSGHFMTEGPDRGALYYTLVMSYFWDRLN